MAQREGRPTLPRGPGEPLPDETGVFVETNVNSFRVNNPPSKTESSDQGDGTINKSARGSPTT